MRKRSGMLMGMCFLAVSVAAFAQSSDTMKQGDEMKHDSVKADKMAKKAVTVSGKVSDDGKTLTSDKDNKDWMISNPGAVKGHEGRHVIVKGQVDGGKNEIHVGSLKMAKDKMKDTMKKDDMHH